MPNGDLLNILYIMSKYFSHQQNNIILIFREVKRLKILTKDVGHPMKDLL
jgi:hypothetical protein